MSVSRILLPRSVALTRPTIIHLRITVARYLLRPTRKLWAGHPKKLPYLVLHRVGFTEHPRSPGDLVRSYRTVAPLPRHPSYYPPKDNKKACGAVLFLWH